MKGNKCLRLITQAIEITDKFENIIKKKKWHIANLRSLKISTTIMIIKQLIRKVWSARLRVLKCLSS